LYTLPFPRTSACDFVELSSDVRDYFLVWDHREVKYASGGMVGNLAPHGAGTAITFDGSPYEKYAIGAFVGGGGGNIDFPTGVHGVKAGLSEGRHFGSLMGVVSGQGTAQAPYGNRCLGTNRHPSGGQNHPLGGIDCPVSLTITVDG
jgi:hypothetical protein